MTEKDARGKWCPYTTIILLHRKPGDEKGVSPVASNHPGMKGTNCEASGCMAWRWIPGEGPAQTDQPSGYCGLAGQDLYGITEGKTIN